MPRPLSPRRWPRPSSVRWTRRCRSRAKTTRCESGKVVIASITSCTNTSNPYVMIGAGLVARKAAALGLDRKPWVKTSLAPGSQVVSDYLEAAGLQDDLDKIGFNLVGYGCTTCIGNSGPLQAGDFEAAIADGDLVAMSVLSGNRNFEGRISPDVRANYLASPPLVVAYALAGTMDIDMATEPIGPGPGRQRRLPQGHLADHGGDRRTGRADRDARSVPCPNTPMSSRATRSGRACKTTDSLTYDWPPTSTYVQNPPYFQGMAKSRRHDQRRRGRPGAGDPGRHGHDRPHLAGGVVQGDDAGGRVSDRTAGARRASSTPTDRAAATTR